MKNSKKWLWIGLLVVVLASGLIWNISSKPKTFYKEYVVARGDLQIKILTTGTVQPENRLEIKAPIAGRIDTVLATEGNRVKKGQILAWMSSTDRAALLDAARARGPEEVTRWEEIYKAMPIIAPLPGTIILRNIEPGQTITANDAIFAMSDRLTVKAQVDETDISKIKLHQKAELLLDAYPDQSISAVVDQIAFEAKTVNNVTTYVVDVLPAKVPDFLRSGMTANVRFEQQSRDNVLLVSADALIVSDGKTKVLVKGEGSNKPEEKEIQIGLSDGKRTEVISGLNENDVVVRVDISKLDKTSSSSPFSPFGTSRKSTGGGSGGVHK
ncbi:MAG: HlyD family efflux transporter periplasmic adaptor subunit [Pseudobdellovibrio sp.]